MWLNIMDNGGAWFCKIAEGRYPALPADGVDATIPAWTAAVCGKTLGNEPAQEKGRQCARLVMVAQGRELAAWEELAG